MNAMRTQKTEWKNIGIPREMFDAIQRILPYVGCLSVSEYVRAQVASQLPIDEMRAEKMEEVRKEIELTRS